MKESCQTCYYARKAGNDSKIACGLCSGIKHGLIENLTCPHCGEVIGSTSFEEFFPTVHFENEDGVYEGWAALSCAPDGKPSLLTSECIIVDLDNSCNYWKSTERRM